MSQSKLTEAQFNYLRSLGFTNIQLHSKFNQERFAKLFDRGMQPTYYVRHPDDSYSVAEPQPPQADVARDALDAKRWRFTMWWQDQKPRPEHIQNCLSDMHRWARKRGALGPNSEELQRATDNAIDAAMSAQGAQHE